MNSSHYIDANLVTQPCNLTHLIYEERCPSSTTLIALAAQELRTPSELTIWAVAV